MRTVFVHLKSATEDECQRFLDEFAVHFAAPWGNQWNYPALDDAKLYIEVEKFNAWDEREPEDIQRVLNALGGNCTASIVADVSGRHPGDEEVRALVLAALDRFEGVAEDDYSQRCWTRTEVLNREIVEGLGFFDYDGDYRRTHGT